jgi:hypothetical protein
MGRFQVHFQIFDFETVIELGTLSVEERSDADQEFDHRERLHQIVIGAGIQTKGSILYFTPGSEEQERHRFSTPPRCRRMLIPSRSGSMMSRTIKSN